MEQTSKKTIVSLKDIFIKFDGEVILNHINLDINEKEFVTILGPSGCGKTTTLRIIGGFVEPDSGDVIFGGKRINGTPPNKRNVNTVFQKYSLFPHLNVFDNVAFGLKLKKMPKDEIKKRVTDMLATVDLKGYEKRSVAKLSGGQQQRVAIARALVKKPEVLLLDEPLSNLDAKLRVETREEIRRIQQEVGITTIFVTHDQEEAMSISDRIAVMEKGVVQQFEVPQKMYLNPGNLFVAQFLGTPQINIFDVTVKGGKIMCGDVVLREGCTAADGNYKAGVRPEAFNVSENGILVKATHVRMTGRELQLRVALAKEELRVLVHSDMQVSVGTEFCVTIRDNQILLFDQTGKTVGKY